MSIYPPNASNFVVPTLVGLGFSAWEHAEPLNALWQQSRVSIPLTTVSAPTANPALASGEALAE